MSKWLAKHNVYLAKYQGEQEVLKEPFFQQSSSDILLANQMRRENQGFPRQETCLQECRRVVLGQHG